MTKQHVYDTVEIYIRAWVQQDPDLIATIFTETATYHERVLDDPIPDRDAIQKYWQTKVVESQANITCAVRNLHLDGTTAIVEWEAEFDDIPQGVRKHMREIAVLEFEGPLIKSLREYWSSKRIATLDISQDS
ncbi:MAG: nuclear transport factor 2 family protein [Corynebacteriales bacterium]|nr:nuclear transport factor 2 family protein [Mycobacteriales bacterium]